MERLTIPDERIPGGTRRKVISVKAVKEEAMTLYWQLKKYEDTGLTPDHISELDRLYLEKCREVTELKKQKEWIPVKERLPEKGERVLACTEDGYTVCYHTGKEWVNAIYPMAWMPLPAPYKEAEG